MMYNHFKMTEETFLSTIEEWIEKHSKDFTKDSVSPETRYRNSHGEFLQITIRRTKFGEVWEKALMVGDKYTSAWLCTWDIKLNKFSSLDEENLDILPHTELTPYVAELIKEFRKHEKVYEFHTGKYDRWDD